LGEKTQRYTGNQAPLYAFMPAVFKKIIKLIKILPASMFFFEKSID